MSRAGGAGRGIGIGGGIIINGELFRLGGDEFAIHLPAALRKEAIEVAEKALDAVRGGMKRQETQ